MRGYSGQRTITHISIAIDKRKLPHGRSSPWIWLPEKQTHRTYNNNNLKSKHIEHIIITITYIYRYEGAGSKRTDPDAVAKGLQRHATLKNGFFDGRNKKPSPPPGWETIRLG